MTSPRSDDKMQEPYPPSRLHAQQRYNQDAGFIEVASYYHSQKRANFERHIRELEKRVLPDDEDCKSDSVPVTHSLSQSRTEWNMRLTFSTSAIFETGLPRYPSSTSERHDSVDE